MAKCANRNTAEYKSLKKRFGTNIKTDNIIDNYQQANNTEDIPSVADALKYQRDVKASLASTKLGFMQALGKNIINTRKASRFKGQIYVNNSIKGTMGQTSKAEAENNVAAIEAFLDKNNIPHGPGKLVSFQETDNTYRVVFNEAAYKPQDAIPENTQKMSGTTKAVLNHLNRLFPQINIQVLSRTEAKKKYDQLPSWAKSNTPWSSVKSFYFDKNAYIVGSSVTGDVAIEEVLHPLIDAIYVENKELFDGLLAEAKVTFGQLKQQIDQAYSKERRFTQTQRDIELVTQALVRHFRKEYETKPTQGFMQKVKELLEWFAGIIKDLNKFITGRDLKVDNIKPTASLSDIARLLNTENMSFKFEFRRSGKVRYALTPLAEKAYQNAIDSAVEDVQVDLAKKLHNKARTSTETTTDLSVSKNSEFFDSSNFIIKDNKEHRYFDIESGLEFLSATTAMKGKLANEEDVALNLAIGNDFDAILNAVAADILLEDIQGDLTKLSKEQAFRVYADLQAHLSTIKADGSIVLPQVMLYSDQEITAQVFNEEGKLVTVTYGGLAGTIDLLVIKPDGKLRIIDLKTSQNYLKTDPEKYDRPYNLPEDSVVKQKLGTQQLSTRAQHNLQISLYRRMLENMGYTMDSAVNAVTTFHVKVNITKDKNGKKTWDGTYEVEGTQVHDSSDMIKQVDSLVEERESYEKAKIDAKRKESGEYNPTEDEDFLTEEEKKPEENNTGNTEIDVYLGALEKFQKGLLTRRKALQTIKGGVTLDKSKQATIESINETLGGIEIAITEGPAAIKAEYTRVIRQAIKDVQEYTDYILDPVNVGKPEYINYVLNFERYSLSFNGLIDLIDQENTPLSKTQANLVITLRSKIQNLKGTDNTPGLVDTATFNYVKETVKAVSSAELSEADLEDILTTVREMSEVEYLTGDLATNKDTLLAVLDKIYKAKAQEYLDKAQAREELIRSYANRLAKLDPSTKPQDLYDYMLEFDKEGLPTGFIVQRLGAQYYDKISEIRNSLFDEDGNRKEYLEIYDIDKAKEKDLKYNRDLYILKQAAASFWKAEQVDENNNIIDGNYHRYSDAFKELRSKYETPTVTESGAVFWSKKRTVSNKAWRSFRNNHGEYKETFFAQKINGEATGVVSPASIWVPNNKYRIAKDNATVNGKKVSMLNDKYFAIMNPAANDALAMARKEFYQFYVETMDELVGKLPPNMVEQMQGRIPTIKRAIGKKLKSEGPVFIKMFAGMKKKTNNFFSETGTFRRVVTNEKDEMVNSLPIYFTGSLASEKDIKDLEEKIEINNKLRKDGKLSLKDFEEEQGKLRAQLSRVENKATKDTLSTDLGSSLLKFNSMAENFEVMSSIEDIVTSFIKVSDKRSVLAEKAANERVSKGIGKLRNVLTPVGKKENDVEKRIKKRIKKWASMVYYDNENITQGALEKMTNGLLGYSSFAYVATNPLGNINNLVIGRLNNTIELLGGKYYDRKAYARMTAAFNREQVVLKQIKRTGYILDGKKGVYDPKKPMTKWEGWVDYLRMMDTKVEVRETGAIEEGQSYAAKTAEWFYLLNDSFEYNVQTKQGMAMVDSYTAVDPGGNSKSLYEASTFDHDTQSIVIDPKYKIFDRDGNEVVWDEKHRYQLRNNIREVNKRVHGSYARADRMVMQSHFVGKLAVQFKKWVVPSVKNRFRKEYYDENLGWTEGRYRSWAKFMAYAFKNIQDIGSIQDSYKEQLMKEYNNETGINYGHIDKRVKEQIANTYQTLGEIGLVLLVYSFTDLLGSILESDDDDGYWTKRLKNITKYNADRAFKELVAFWPIVGYPQAWQLIKNPIASAGVVGNFAEAVLSTVGTGAAWLYQSEEDFKANGNFVYQRGKDKKGNLKLSKEWADILPFLYTIQRVKNFDQERDFYID